MCKKNIVLLLFILSWLDSNLNDYFIQRKFMICTQYLFIDYIYNWNVKQIIHFFYLLAISIYNALCSKSKRQFNLSAGATCSKNGQGVWQATWKRWSLASKAGILLR